MPRPGFRPSRRRGRTCWHIGTGPRPRIFKRLVAEGAIPPRSGIARIINAALAAGWTVAVASTSAEESVSAVLRRAVGDETADRIPVFAGDVVPGEEARPGDLPADRRPSSASTRRTRWWWRTRATGCWPRPRAGLRCLVTVNGYTRDENFDEAMLVVSELGDPGRPPIEVLADRAGAAPGAFVTLDDLRACLTSTVEQGVSE